MKKNVLVLVTIIIIFVMMCSGCQQKATQNYSKVILESDIVEIKNADLTLINRSEYVNDTDPTPTRIIIRADVTYLFHNIAGRDISVKVTAVFYDKDNNVIAGGGPKTIQLFNDYTEQSITPANTISYEGENVALVDHVKIIAVEA